ncbi:glycosyl transferase [Collibacillus ludicampi]|uniref:Glycosyl transferase n=1 Tax=Collibacillus ludicampi TaxID=2771369 RepID=A0AAV4LH26_9BACL|nr:glycosyltransferase [Collibacillus ludicampi]GIM46809.1 glycosyl transferase [Collibacillus ludicampi]
MNVLLILPPGQPASGGNVTYSHRLKRGLAPRGIRIHIVNADQVTENDFAQADLVHVYNAYRTGCRVLPDLKRLHKPMILTITGTDVNEYFYQADTHEMMLDVLHYASRIIVLTHSARNELIEALPEVAGKAVVINLGVDLPQGSTKSREEYGFGQDDFIFLLPAGIRPVKDPLFAYEPLSSIHKEFPQIRFVLAGPRMDEKLFSLLETKLAESEWMKYLGEVPHEEMPALMKVSDVVMNTSKSEGLSHALLEAMSLRKPVLASHVPGNIDLIEDGKNGLLFRDADELAEKARTLILDSELRARLGEAGRLTVETFYSVENEINQFESLYREACAEVEVICGGCKQ